MTFNILDHLDKLTPVEGKGTASEGEYHCPKCGAENFKVNLKTGKYSGFSCSCTDTKPGKQQVIDAISPPLPPKDSKPPAKAARTAQSRDWVYKNSEGENLIKVCRKDFNKDGKDGKRIWQQFWNNGAWRKTGDVPAESKENAYTTVVPLNWEKIRPMAEEKGYLFVVEGEQVADTLVKLGIPATTYIKNSRNDARFFDGLNLVLCPDQDTPGIATMEALAEKYPDARWAYAFPGSPAWQNPPEKNGVDFHDWVTEGATAEQVLATILPPGGKRHKVKESNPPAKEEKIPKPKDSKVAAELREKYQDRLAFNTQSEQWLFYGHTTTGLWDIIPDVELESIIQAELDTWPGLEDGYSMSFVTSVVNLLRGRLNRYSWDEQPNLLPFTNGVYNLDTGKLLPHAPGYGFIWQLPRPFLTITPGPLEAVCPTISTFLGEATGGSTAMQHTLLCWLNAVLKGRCDLQKFLHMVGPGGTGKGTFLRLATMLIGECNAHSSALDVLNTDKFEQANLVGKRLVIFSDEDKYNGRLAVFKKMTGGDLLRAEEKRKKAHPFRFRGMAMVASNYPIFAGDTSSGLNRRLLTVPFTVLCSTDKWKDLDAEFEPELAALTTYLLSIDDATVTKALRGIHEQPPEVVELSWEMRMRTDSLAAWLNDCIVKKPASDGYYESVGSDAEDQASLFGSYYQWCKKTGSRPAGLREFSPRLIDLCQSVIGWDDVERKRLTSGEGKGRFVVTGLQLRMETSTEPYPIDALVDAHRVKGEGSGEGKVKDTVKAGSIDTQGGEGCEGSDSSYTEKENQQIAISVTVSPELSQDVSRSENESKEVDSHPSHPSPLDTATVSAFTPSFTPSFTDPSPQALTVGALVRKGGSASPWLILSIDGGNAEIQMQNPYVKTCETVPLESLEVWQ